MLTRTASDPYVLGQVLYKATGLALTGLAVALALDAGLFNIGGEGQVTAGVLACAAGRDRAAGGDPGGDRDPGVPARGGRGGRR